jgi:uncharacterized protein YbaR (Trm112 family)/predicted SAM-dependent methyltransferase
MDASSLLAQTFRILNTHLLSILACPRCHGDVQAEIDELRCGSCGHRFVLRNGIPLFLTTKVEIVSAEHKSNPLGAEYEAILREGKDLVLHIGAGATVTRHPNCVEFEHKIFRHTDVVGDAHHLPFRDAVFDRVFAFNVFEHLRDPRAAASEIFRVLKPSGSVAIHTAFLQALHEKPAHFFNATEYGVREWFAQFEIDRCHVSANFSPAYMIAYLMSNVLECVRTAEGSIEDKAALSRTTIGEWAAFWAEGKNPPSGFQILQDMPQELQKGISAGFELLARKPSA